MTIILAFIFGCFMGSFLNVLTLRLPQEKSIHGRSGCPHCNHQLMWLDLIPILSFIFLLGKCRYCKKPISYRYPLLEVVTGFLFALAISQTSVFTPASAVYLLTVAVIASVCVIVFIIDLEHYLILDKVMFPAMGIVLGLLIVYAGLTHNWMLVAEHLISAAAAFIPFWAVSYFSNEKWMGYGDSKLAVFMGLALGWPDIAVALFLSFVIGGLVGILLLLLGMKQMSSKLPFGTFLTIATILALFWGPQLWNAYWNMLGI